MAGFIIFISIFFILAEIIMFIYLIRKIIHHHSLTLKDTAIYPLVIGITMIIVLLGQFHYANAESVSDVAAALKDGVAIATLSINSKLVMLLWEGEVAAKFLMFSYIGSYIISAFALLSLSISLLKVAVFNFFRRTYDIYKERKEKNIIFGFNEEAKEYIKNLSLENRRKTIVALNNSIIDKYVDEKLFLDKFGVKFKLLPYSNKNEMYKSIRRATGKTFFSKFKFIFSFSLNANVYIISFLDKDKDNFEFIRAAKQYLSIYNKFSNMDKKNGNVFFPKQSVSFIIATDPIQNEYLEDYIYSNDYFDDIKNNLTEEEIKEFKEKHFVNSKLKDKSQGLIRCFNKYELTSLDFINRYSLAQFMDGYINPNCTVKNDCDINLYLLGFGNVNQVLLRDILVCNQFAEVVNGKLKSKKINVRIYEKNIKFSSILLSNGILKYNKADYDRDSYNSYFGLIDDYYSKINFNNFNTVIGENGFMNELYDTINAPHNNRKQFNFFIISIGTDFENCMLANTLSESFSSVGDRIKNVFFARTKEDYKVNDGIFTFGENSKVLSYENVVKDSIHNLARNNHYYYSERQSPKDNDRMADLIIKYKWAVNCSLIKKKSNLYSAYGLHSKFALLNVKNKKEFREKYIIPNYDTKYIKLSFENIEEDVLFSDLVIINNYNKYSLNDEGKDILFGNIDPNKPINNNEILLKVSRNKENNHILFNTSTYIGFKKNVGADAIIKAYALTDEKEENGNELFFDYYDNNSNIISGEVCYKSFIGFKIDAKLDILSTTQDKFDTRTVLSFIEHERWNAFELSVGVLPRKIEYCFTNGGFSNKADNELYHATITTQEGLLNYYNLLIEKGFIFDADVISYDYDMMDYLYEEFDSVYSKLNGDGKNV